MSLSTSAAAKEAAAAAAGESATNELRAALAEKAQELFRLCDIEQKGFMNRRDMQRLAGVLPLTSEQIEIAFDLLDSDGNGCLTLEEFVGGFGAFAGIKPGGSSETANGTEKPHAEGLNGDLCNHGNSTVCIHGNGAEVYSLEEDEQYNLVMGRLVASGVLKDEDTMRTLWQKLQTDHPDLVPSLESLLARMTEEILRSHDSCKMLEDVLHKKTSAHSEEIRRLYEEMEAQIRAERAKILAEERAREKQLRKEFEREIREKERLYEELMKKHEGLEYRLAELNQVSAETAQEKERLARERDALEEELAESREELDESRSYVEELQRKFKEDRRRRAQSSMRLTEGIALEREGLVRQLARLRDDNRRLKDATDMAGGMDGAGNGAGFGEVVHFRDSLNRQESLQSLMASAAVVAGGETLADIMDGPDDGCEFDDLTGARFLPIPATAEVEVDDDDDAFEMEEQAVVEETICPVAAAAAYSKGPTATAPLIRPQMSDTGTMMTPRPSLSLAETIAGVSLRCQTDIQTDEACAVLTPPPPPLPTQLEPLALSMDAAVLEEVRASPEGAGDDEDEFLGPMESVSEAACFSVNKPPERVFKVVFIGDSGVGKSSVIHRLCQNAFKSTFAATIGIDFQVKALELEGQVIALQLWDTAGQERFRSITKQYFRKADGIVIVYDVTHAQSFLHLREWLDCVCEGDGDAAVKMLLGNKIDLLAGDSDKKATKTSSATTKAKKEVPPQKGLCCGNVAADEGGPIRQVETEDARRLADECGAGDDGGNDAPALFFEVSAKSGASVGEAFVKFAMLLREREDRQLKQAIRISAEIEKKKGCCSSFP